MSVKEVAAALRQHPATIYRKVHSGQLPAVRTGNGHAAIRILEDELEQWLCEAPVASPESPASAADPSSGQSSGLRSAGNEEA
jgi:excisionase family DNA binding protein